MKFLLFILPCLLAGATRKDDTTAGKEKFYYYCHSQSIKSPPVKGSNYVLYTDVKEVFCEETELLKITKEWKKKVGTLCVNEAGCTSDLNYYPSLQEATDALEETKKAYSDLSKYNARKVEFKSSL